MRLLTIAEAAAEARVSERLLREQIKLGCGPRVTRPGGAPTGRVLVREDCLEQWIDQRTEPAPAKAAE